MGSEHHLPEPKKMEMDEHIQRILWTEKEIADRIAELGSDISNDFQEYSPPLVIIGVAMGAFLFLADIVRKITLPVVVDFIKVTSYGSGLESNGSPQICNDVKIDIKDKHVIVIEDIVDTGHTLSCIIPHLEGKGASSVSVCTLLDKPGRRKIDLKFNRGKFYRGFECPDNFVVGYGMDYAELYRNLPYVGILKPEIYE